MKKIFLSIAMMFVAFGAFAQIKIGADISESSPTSVGYHEVFTMCPNVSLFVNCPFGKRNFYGAADLDYKFGPAPKSAKANDLQFFNIFELLINAGYEIKFKNPSSLDIEIGTGYYYQLYKMNDSRIKNNGYNYGKFLFDAQVKYNIPLPSDFALHLKAKYEMKFGSSANLDLGIGINYSFD